MTLSNKTKKNEQNTTPLVCLRGRWRRLGTERQRCASVARTNSVDCPCSCCQYATNSLQDNVIINIIIIINDIYIAVLWHCSLGGRKGIWPIKNWVLGCWHGYLSESRCRLAYGSADATATHLSLASVKCSLILPLCYRHPRVVPDRGTLIGCWYMAQILKSIKCVKSTEMSSECSSASKNTTASSCCWWIFAFITSTSIHFTHLISYRFI